MDSRLLRRKFPLWRFHTSCIPRLLITNLKFVTIHDSIKIPTETVHYVISNFIMPTCNIVLLKPTVEFKHGSNLQVLSYLRRGKSKIYRFHWKDDKRIRFMPLQIVNNH